MDGRDGAKVLDQREPHTSAVASRVAHFVHDFANDVNTKTAGADVIEVARADRVRVDLLGVVFDDDLDPGRLLLAFCKTDPDATVFTTVVPVLDDVAQRLIDGEADLPALDLVEPAALGDT